MGFSYFKLTDAFNDVRDSFSFGSGSEKLASTAKLLGKTVANVGILATEAGVELVKLAPEIIGKVASDTLNKGSNSLPDEKKEKLQKLVEKGDEARKRREDGG